MFFLRDLSDEGKGELGQSAGVLFPLWNEGLACRLLFCMVKNVLDALPQISRFPPMARSGILISITKWFPSCPPYNEEISFF